MDYEEYMRNVLGYQPIKYDNTYNMNYNMINNDSKPIFNNYQVQELENCYPDIYRIIYPMIQKVCSQNIGNITKEVIDRMTDEVYFAVEDREMLENRNKEEKQNISEEKRKVSKNQSLNDLIRILILRELLLRQNLNNFYRDREGYYPKYFSERLLQKGNLNLNNRNIFEQYNDLYEH